MQPATTEHTTNEQMIEILGWTLGGIHYVNEKGQPTGYSSDVVDWTHLNPIDNLEHVSIVEARLAELDLDTYYTRHLKLLILRQKGICNEYDMVTASPQTRCDAAWATWTAWMEGVIIMNLEEKGLYADRWYQFWQDEKRKREQAEHEREEVHTAAMSLAQQVNELRAQVKGLERQRDLAEQDARQRLLAQLDTAQYVRGLEAALEQIHSMFDDDIWFKTRESHRIQWRTKMRRQIEQVLAAKEDRG